MAMDAGVPMGREPSRSDSGGPDLEPRFQKLIKRTVMGLLLGAFGGSIVLVGGLPFAACVAAGAYLANYEYAGMMTIMRKAPKRSLLAPPLILAVLSALCVALPLVTYLYPSGGRLALALTISVFVLLVMEVVTVEKPHFSQLTAAVFGLFYCGFLPTFWVKLRMFAAPSLRTPAAASWPVLLGGLSHWTVGLVATLTTVVCIIASDTGAFCVGKYMGKTQLIKVSPKKTVEGTVGGLVASMVVGLACRQVLNWPSSALGSLGLSVLVFVASACGDLIESVFKREAGIKDSGNLIPGHGGFLDRFDSYMFTGAMAYMYVKLFLPSFGV